MATGKLPRGRTRSSGTSWFYDMLDGRKAGKRSRQGRSEAGALKRGPRGAMIDWTAVFGTLPGRFTLDSLVAHETAGVKTRGYLRHVVALWSKEDRIRCTGRGMYERT